MRNRLTIIIVSGVSLSLCWALSSSPRKARSQEVASTMKTIQVGTVTRSYLLHLPVTYARSRRYPLVLVFHGGDGQPQMMERYTGMSELADRRGFIVVYPEGINKHWNDGRPGAPNIDDVAFVRALIKDLMTHLKIDSKRIYASGFSNGGMFTQRLACELSGSIAAVGSVAASIPDSVFAACKPMNSISVLMIHGTNDPLVPYDGGPMPKTTLGGSIVSLPNAIRFWAQQNNCSQVPLRKLLQDVDPNDGTRINREAYRQCKGKAEVVLYSVQGGGHTLPGGMQYLPEQRIGVTSRDINGTETIWDFFARHSLRAVAPVSSPTVKEGSATTPFLVALRSLQKTHARPGCLECRKPPGACL